MTDGVRGALRHCLHLCALCDRELALEEEENDEAGADADVAHDVPLPAIETLARGFRDDTAALYTVLLRADVKELILRLDFNGWYSSDRT